MFGCGRGGIIRTKNNAAKQKITQNIFTDNLQKQKRGTNHTLLYLAGDVGLEPTHAGFRIRCLNQLGESPIFRPQKQARRRGRIMFAFGGSVKTDLPFFQTA